MCAAKVYTEGGGGSEHVFFFYRGRLCVVLKMKFQPHHFLRHIALAGHRGDSRAAALTHRTARVS